MAGRGPLDEETERLIVDGAIGVLERLAVSGDESWAALSESGLPFALLSEDAGGFGLGASAFAVIVGAAAALDAPQPIGEAMIANMLLVRAGARPVDGIATLAAQDHHDGWHADVPHGGVALTTLFEVGNTALAAASADQVRVLRNSRNLAGHPRADIRVDALPVGPMPGGSGALMRCGAALRTIQMAGAAEAVLALTVDYVNVREQFGRPLGKFQAIQQEMARMAGQVAVIGGAAGIASEFLTGSLGPSLALAAAKARASEAAGVIAAIAHQAHGAIGFTDEYRLGRLTKSLWSWRAEFGGQAYWQAHVADAVFARGADELWATVIAA